MQQFLIGVFATIGGICTFIVAVAAYAWWKDEQSKKK